MRSGKDCRGLEWEEIDLSPYMKNLSGRKFGRLTATFPVICNGKKRWLCRCDCGNDVAVRVTALTSGNTKSCGCLLHDIISQRWKQFREDSDVIGKKYGRLTVIDFVKIKNQEAIYLFECDCGKRVELSMHSVKQGVVKSCGCLKQDRLDSFKSDIIGKKFGNLLVLSYVGINAVGGTKFDCLCDCGEHIVTDKASLKRGLVRSCGCIRSLGENNIKSVLSEAGINYIPQYKFPDLVSTKNKKLPYDFAIIDDAEQVLRLIEFDGPQHIKPYDFFGGIEKFLTVQENDNLKNQYALSHDIPLVRIPYKKKDSIAVDDLMGEKYLINAESGYL